MSLGSLHSAGLLSSRTYENLEKLSTREDHQVVSSTSKWKIKLLDGSKKPTLFSEVFKRTTYTDTSVTGQVLLANLSELNRAIKVLHSQDKMLSSKTAEQLLKVSQQVNKLSQQILSPKLKANLIKANEALAQHLENDEIKWIAQISPRLASEVQNAKTVLSLSEDPKVPLEQRMKLAPKTPSSGMGVSFFVSTVKVPVPDSSKSLTTEVKSAESENIKSTFIAKSASREDGRADTNHFPQGQGPMRERMANTVQSVLGFDCGVPPTSLATLPGSAFSANARLNHLLEQLNQELPLLVDAQKVIKYGGNPCDIQAFKMNLVQESLNSLNEIVESNPALQLELKNILETLEPGKEIVLTENLKMLEGTQQPIFNTLLFIQSLMNPTPELDQKIQDTWNEIANPTETSQSSLVSCQQLVTNCTPLEDLTPEEQAMISAKQFEKCLLDILMPNSDRGLQNILVKKTPLEKASKNLMKALDINPAQFNQLVKDLKLDPQSNMEKKFEEFISVLKMLKGSQHTVSLANENLIHAFMHATANKYSEVLEFVMIDNSQGLPSFESPDGKALRSHVRSFTAQHDWANFPQVASLQITGSNRKKILNLDVDAFIAQVKSDQLAHLERFGTHCEINNSCFDLLRINIMFLKAGILNNLSMSELNAFTQKSVEDGKVSSSPLAKLYIAHFLDAQGSLKAPDWGQIQLAINAVAAKPI